MVSYSLASVVDTGGDVLEIIDVVPNTTVMMEPGVQYLKLSAMAAEKIESNLSSGKRCAVAKGLQTEITPNDILVREAQSDVEFTTVTYRSKIHDLFTNSLLVGNIIMYYKFIELNNKLVSAGYTICNDNREEKYLEIIETGDESLIADLEKYLEIKDLLNILDWKLQQINNFESEASKCETEADAKTVGEKFYNLLLEPTTVVPRYTTLPAIAKVKDESTSGENA